MDEHSFVLLDMCNVEKKEEEKLLETTGCSPLLKCQCMAAQYYSAAILLQLVAKSDYVLY